MTAKNISQLKIFFCSWKLILFNFLLYEGTKANSSLIEFGKKNYINIAEMRTRLELLHRRDMLNLYDVSKFLKAKKISDGYSELPSNG